MALESGIAQLVEEFIAAGRPSSREQNIDDRRAGYIASTTLAGETETRVQVEDIELNAMTFRVVSPLNATGNYPASFIIMVAALSAAVLPLTITS